MSEPTNKISPFWLAPVAILAIAAGFWLIPKSHTVDTGNNRWLESMYMEEAYNKDEFLSSEIKEFCHPVNGGQVTAFYTFTVTVPCSELPDDVTDVRLNVKVFEGNTEIPPASVLKEIKVNDGPPSGDVLLTAPDYIVEVIDGVSCGAEVKVDLIFPVNAAMLSGALPVTDKYSLVIEAVETSHGQNFHRGSEAQTRHGGSSSSRIDLGCNSLFPSQNTLQYYECVEASAGHQRDHVEILQMPICN